ncbi:alpha/beta fold hydrolase [Nesterenkonia muleiensis]|uniref:alpha/beta fold hydrolase n=1 Tax=Nesterenkonia muleiensis TaxID=2282648 RepID=UPI000E72252F|nr:alpha/beta hydrolase [Nesterenkonia muleiensis]
MHAERSVVARWVLSGDAQIYAEAFGESENPAVLLICGASTSMDFWDAEFCTRLAGAGRYVIRYDLRDTGCSTSYPAGEPGYTGADLVGDSLAVLDGFDVEAAHVVGISMGGAIAQRMALEHPGRVTSLILMATSPISGTAADGTQLPSMEPRLAEYSSAGGPEADWADRETAIEAIVEGERPFAGTIPFDAERMRRTAARSFDRTVDMAAMQTNHWIAEEGPSIGGQLDQLRLPALILHGTDDPLFSLAHGEALAKTIPGARLVPLPGMGHQYPPEPLWDQIVTEIIDHTDHAG